MWWTQPKLALIALGVNGMFLFASTLPVVSSDRAVAALITLQVILLFAYGRVADRLGNGHLDGATEASFDRKLWNKEWKPRVDPLLVPYGQMPRPGGESFYKQVVGDTRETHDALYRALALWEGARLSWFGSAVGLAAALAASTLPLLAWPRDIPWVLYAPAGVAFSVWALVLPESFNILLLRKRVLRLGLVERAALLVPRSAADVGLAIEDHDPHGSRLEAIVVFSVAGGIPLAILVTLAAGIRGLALGAIGGALVFSAVVYSIRAYRTMLVSGIPFLRFSCVPEVNVLLDLMHRQRAFLSFHPLTAVMFSLMALIEPLRYGFLGPLVFYEIGYIVTVTFGDQLSGYAGFMTASNFDQCFRRSMKKMEPATP